MIDCTKKENSSTAQNSGDLRGFVNLVIGERYITQSPIGEGGWSVVYKAFDRVLHRDVAIKLLHRPLAANTENLARFEREARTASTLNHPNIGGIYDYGVLPTGQPYMVMELLRGSTLAELIEKKAITSEGEVLGIIRQVAAALAHAHQKGILHRDVKPSNILILSASPNISIGTRQVKLLDFGLAKCIENDKVSTLTDSGVLVGTPSYMSPEQCRRARVDHRTDIYSLGCTMYELLSGVKPFQGGAADCMHAHLLEEPLSMRKHTSQIQITHSIERIVRQAMAKNPESRFKSMEEMLKAISMPDRKGAQYMLPQWGEIASGLRTSLKLSLRLACGLCLITSAYYAAPHLLDLVGVKTVEIDAAALDKRALDEVVKEMAITGKL
ncbi:MAG: serine/threonine protein kinase [Candidatus Melainabacteria bacterium]|nr:serine/threonine protein kinase [Candidatus Melainabacteria bacterium]